MTTRHISPPKESFDWLFGVTAEPLLLIDAAPNLAESVVCAANPAALELHGLPLVDIVDHPYGDLLGPPAGDDSPLSGVAGAVVWHRNGSEGSFPVARTVTNVPWDADLQLVALSPLGIPGQPRTSFLHAQRLETLGMVAGQVAHDLNNVLVSILTDAALLVEELTPGDPIRERLSAIAIAGRDARALTRQLVRQASASLDHQEVDVNALIDDALLLFAAVAGPDAETRFEAGDVPPIEGNPVHLRQAILNLLLNANAALTRGAGSITITTAVVLGSDIPTASLASRETPLPQRHYLAIAVEDTGEGMSQHILARAFEPFFTTRVDGTGLGLPAVVASITAHEGIVGAISTPGQGSRFTIYLPA